jgi:DNA-binding response OmpR family regulator
MNNLPHPVSTRVLVIEDNPVDVRLLRYAISQDRSWDPELIVAVDGEKAIHLLQQGLPDFIILDLNLPKLDGTEVLQWIRSGEATRNLPVAIVSSSPMDEIRSKITGARVEANGYFMKPMDVDSFVNLAKALGDCYRATQQNSDSE